MSVYNQRNGWLVRGARRLGFPVGAALVGGSGAAIGAAVNSYNARQANFRRNRMMTSSGTQSGGVVTTNQHDFQRQYRRKKMPRRKRKNWKRKVKSFHYMMDQTLGTKTIVRNTQISASQATDTPQGTLIAHLYGLSGTEQPFECGTRDLLDIGNNDTTNTTGMLRFKSAVLDLTMRNTSTTIGIEADVYEVVYRDYTNETGWRAAQSDAETATNNINGGTGLALTQRGTTLFEFPERIKLLKEKILKKTKIFLPAGQTATYQIRVAKNKICNKRNVTEDATGFVYPYWTRSVIICFKSVIGDAVTCSMTVGVTRKYSYVISEQNAVADQLL